MKNLVYIALGTTLIATSCNKQISSTTITEAKDNQTFADLDNPEKFTKLLETEPFQVISSYDPDKRKRYIRI